MKRPITGISSTIKQTQQLEKVVEEPVTEEEVDTEINFTVLAEGHGIPNNNKIR